MEKPLFVRPKRRSIRPHSATRGDQDRSMPGPIARPPSVRSAMRGYLLQRPQDPLAARLAAQCTSTAVDVLVRVLQASQLAVRPLLSPMYARHGLRVRCFLAQPRGDGAANALDEVVPIGRVHESPRNADGSVHQPVWTGERMHFSARRVDGLTLVVEIVCGILVVAAVAVPLAEWKASGPRWVRLEGEGAGIVQLSVDIKHTVVGGSEDEDDLAIGASAWSTFVSSKLAEHEEGDREEEEDDEPAIEYSSSSDGSFDDCEAFAVEDSILNEDSTPDSSFDTIRDENSTPGNSLSSIGDVKLERNYAQAVHPMPPNVVVTCTGATTLYMPPQTAGNKANNHKVATEHERRVDEQVRNLYRFGIAVNTTDASEELPRLSLSRTASTCPSDVLNYSVVIQNLEKAIEQERATPRGERPVPLGQRSSRHSQHSTPRGERPSTRGESTPSSEHGKNEANVSKRPPIARPARTPEPQRPGVVLFDPAALQPATPPSTFWPDPASRLAQRRRSAMAAPPPAPTPQSQGRRRSLPINAMYESLHRRIAGVLSRRPAPAEVASASTQRSSAPLQPPAIEIPAPQPLNRKRSMSLHAASSSRPMSSSAPSAPNRLRSSSFERSSSSSAPSSSGPVRPGRRLQVGRAATGVVRYVGPVHFAPGQWLGVQLDKPIGKHDGAVNGVRYFSCARNHGILLRSDRLDLRLL